MKTFLYKKTDATLRILRFTDLSSKSDEVEVKGEGLSFRNERDHPLMGFFCICPFWDETKPFSNPEDMGVNRKGFSPQTKKKETVNGLRSNSFEVPHGLLDFL